MTIHRSAAPSQPVPFRASIRPKGRENENEPFAKRNESFRSAGRKALKSLWVPNQHFAGLFVFNGLTAFSFRAVFKWSSLSQSQAPTGSGSASRGPKPSLLVRNM
jgi:hypothetical protein